MAFGSAGGYSFASLVSSSLLETETSFRRNIEKIVPNKVKNPRRIQIERKMDPNDFYLEQKEKEKKMKAIMDSLQDDKKYTETQKQLQMYHLRKNFIFGLIAGAIGVLINRRILSTFYKRSLPIYLSIPFTAPLAILSYYTFSGTFDNMPLMAVIDKFAREAPVLIAVKVAVDTFRLFVKQMSRDANLTNMNLLQKAKAEKIDPKTLKLLRVNPAFVVVSTFLLVAWLIFLVSSFEERVQSDLLALMGKHENDAPEAPKDK